MAENTGRRRRGNKNPAPADFDYDRDGDITDRDAVLQQKDYDGNKTVSPREEQRFYREQGQTTTTYEYDAEGNIISQRTTSKADAPRQKTVSAEDFGYSKPFLDKHPDVAALLRKAIKFKWEPEQFVAKVETDTEFGRRTTDAQAAFAIGITGPKKEEWKQRINDSYDNITRAADSYGIRLTEEQRRQFATNMVRTGLTENDMLSMFARNFSLPETGGRGQQAAPPMQGRTAVITDSIKSLADSYGVTLTDDGLQRKVQQAIKQGGDWREWLQGQENVFRNSAKMLYPKVADRFDEYTLDELLDPYLETATQLLGLPRASMKNTDPRWNVALNGESGAMSQDEWVRKLRTDRQYNWTNTQGAKREIVGQMDTFLSLFGAV